MTYKISRDDVPEAGLSDANLHGGELVTKMVYGNTMSMMYAVRPEEYHSKPHVHDSEQLNYVLEGKIWIFVEDQVDLLTPGDFSRVPEMAVHWSKVEEGPCVMVESHAPPYLDEEIVGEDRERTVGVFGDDEDAEPVDVSTNVWAAEQYAEREAELLSAAREESDGRD